MPRAAAAASRPTAMAVFPCPDEGALTPRRGWALMIILPMTTKSDAPDDLAAGWRQYLAARGSAGRRVASGRVPVPADAALAGRRRAGRGGRGGDGDARQLATAPVR